VSDLDQTRNPEERIQQALAKGPDIDAPGRYGMVTRLVRRVVGRAVKYERDYGLQIDVALLERLHEMEASFTGQLDELSTRLRRELGDDDRRLRESTEQLLDNDHRAQRDLWGVISRVEALEGVLIDVRAHLQELDSRAAVAHAMASGAADGIDSVTLATSQAQAELGGMGDHLVHLSDHVAQLDESAAKLRVDADKAVFVYDELTSRPYIDEDHPLVTNDGRGRACLGYRGVSGPSPLYLGFEDIFRGSEALIRDRQRFYLDVVADRGPVVDLGCGRGEMLELLAQAGIECRGVDLDDAMVDHARANGATVDHGDALEFLVKQEDASLGAIFSAQFIEHLPAGLLPELLELARTKLLPDGVFVAETVNPHSPRALKVFWIDPTHQHPLFPETMLALCRLTGFEEGQIMFPLGGGDLETDLRLCGEYAVVAGAHDLTRERLNRI
jgi:SAM-dependent methyltransferase